MDSGASQCFFRDHTTLTPLLATVQVALADPSSGPVVAHSSTTLPCPVVPSGVLRSLHIPSFTRNLVGVGYLQDKGITVTFVGGGRNAACTDAVTGRVLATFTSEPRSSLYVLHTEHSLVSTSPQVAASPQVPVPPPVIESSQVDASPPVVVSGQVAASCSCRSFTHRTVLWHHRLGHPSIPRLRTMASHRLVSGLPRVFSSLPPSPAPPCTPCVAGCLRASSHSSSLRPATAPFQTLHLDVWGPAPQGLERERYFLVVVDEFSRYTTVFPLAKKSEVTSTLIRWLLATEGTRGRRVSCLHSDRGGEFCSGILARFCGEQGIVQSWMLPESPQQNGVAERRIGLVMDIARTSMIHARAPHFLWHYAVCYAAHQLNLQPRVSRLEASLTSIWTGSPGVGSAFCVKGCLAFVRDTSVDKLSARAVPCVFLGFPVASAEWSFYHPPLHQILDSRDVRFDESVSYYTRYPYRGLPVPPPPFFLAPSLPPAPAPPIPPPPSGLAPSGVSHATPLPSVACQVASPSPQSSSVACQVTVDSVGVGAGGAATGGTRSGGARSRGVGAGGAGTGGASYGGAGAGGAGTGGARIGGAGAGDPDPVGTSSGDIGYGGGLSACARQLDLLEQQQQRQQQQQPPPPPQQLPLERQLFPPVSGLRALGLPSSPLVRPPSLPAFGPTFSPPGARPAVWSSPPPQSPPPVVRHHRSRPCPPSACPSSLITDLHTALLCTSLHRSPPPVSVLLSPPPSSLPVSPTPISDNYRTVRPVVSRVLATGVTDPRFSPSSVSTLTAVVADFGAASRLDYSTRVVPAPPTRPLSVGDPDALDIPTPRTYREAVSRPWASEWKAAMDSELVSWRSTGTYVDAVPPPRVNVVDGIWLFKVKRPPGSPPVFKARYVARGFSLRARFEPIAASIAAHQKLHTWRQLGSVQDYTSRFLALCKQVGYMHESERIDRYIGGLKHDIPQEIQLRCVTDFQEILAMAEKLDFFHRPCPGSYGSNSNWGHQSRGMNKGATIRAVVANAAAAPFKGRCFACNQPGHRKSECPENAKGKGEAKQ
ncbi:unnamed protein product [Closterium sp. NIES-54]